MALVPQHCFNCFLSVVLIDQWMQSWTSLADVHDRECLERSVGAAVFDGPPAACNKNTLNQSYGIVDSWRYDDEASPLFPSSCFHYLMAKTLRSRTCLGLGTKKTSQIIFLSGLLLDLRPWDLKVLNNNVSNMRRHICPDRIQPSNKLSHPARRLGCHDYRVAHACIHRSLTGGTDGNCELDSSRKDSPL